jgi:hypothetical protein
MVATRSVASLSVAHRLIVAQLERSGRLTSARRAAIPPRERERDAFARARQLRANSCSPRVRWF